MLKKRTSAALGRSGFVSHWDAKYHFLCCSENWRMFPAYIWVIRVILGGSEHDLPRKSQLTLGRYFVFWWHSMFYSVKVLSYTSIVNTRDTLTQWSFQPGSHYQCQTDSSKLIYCQSHHSGKPCWQSVIYLSSKFMKNPKSYVMKFDESCDHKDPLSFPLW